MAKLYFRYGAMNSSKSANALMVKHNYEEQGQKVIILKPAVDTRDGEHTIRSRIGLSCDCVLFCDLSEEDVKSADCLIVDEAQFLSKKDCEFLVHVVDDLNVPVICYGLRADFRGELFPGSKYLLAWADTIEEVKTICWCGRKATFNARFDEHGIIREGKQVLLGANEKYTSLCRKHWREGNLGPNIK